MERFWSENKKYIAGVMTIVSVFLFMKYILTLVMPFFLALCLLSAMRPLLRRLERALHIRKSILAGMLLLLVLAVLGVLLWYLAAGLCVWVRGFAGNIDAYEDTLCDFVHSCCRGLEQRVGIKADDMENMIFLHVDRFAEDMKTKAFPMLMNQSVVYARMFGSIAAFLLVTFLATVLLAKDYHNICKDLGKYRLFRMMQEIGKELGGMIGHFLKAQGIILCCISFLCILGLWAAGLRNSFLTGLLAGFMDALPFIGTGCVLVPLAFWQLVQGNGWKCLGILLLYVLCAVTREFLEPKLLGKRLGIYPVVVLLAVYTGIRLYGLSGVILGPLSFLLIREIYRRLLLFREND